MSVRIPVPSRRAIPRRSSSSAAALTRSPAFQRGSGPPALSGLNALRIEFQRVDIRPGFPSETTELAVNYGYVALGEKKYLVPTHADQLSRRGVAFCTKNSIELRDYHPIEGESDSLRK